MADRLVEELLPSGHDSRLRIDWHVGAADFKPEAAGRLLGLVRRALEGDDIAFVMDRTNRPVALAEGIDRRHPALVMTVGLHLPALTEHPAVLRNPATFLEKLGSLARMALSAGVQKREFLRKHAASRPGLNSGFLLERARLGAVPVGLEAAVHALLGQRLHESQEALDLARQTIDRLREALVRDGRSRHLEACLDGPVCIATPASEPAAVAEQVQVATALGDAPGTAVIRRHPDEQVSAARMLELLRNSWQKSALVRVRWLRQDSTLRQLATTW
jgi:hypothetical protein